MQFELFRLSAIEPMQLDAFERKARDGRKFTREEWLRNLFGVDIQFLHRGDVFHYVPEAVELQRDPVQIIAGRVGRKMTLVENAPPEDGLVEREREAWKAAWFLLDPTHHEDGQKVAFQQSNAVGRPAAVLESLISAINAREGEPYVLLAEPLIDAESFWSFVAQNDRQITSVTFEFIVPNMFGHEEDLSRDLKAAGLVFNGEKVTVQIDGKTGLNLANDNTKTAVRRAAQGGGAIKAKTKNGKKYNSKNNKKKKKLTPKEVKGLGPWGLIKLIWGNIFNQ